MLADFGLYLILTDPVVGYRRAAEIAVDKAVPFLQLRMKNSPREEIISAARALRDVTRDSATRFIVNDFVDIAALVDADGCHAGQDDVPLGQARRLWPVPGKLFGLSTHGEAQAASAVARRPDYIGVGPVFPTPTKEVPDPALGLERMGRIMRSYPLPSVAIGGINASNLKAVLEAGARNFAVVRAVNASHEPAAAIDELVSIWKSVSPAPRAKGPDAKGVAS